MKTKPLNGILIASDVDGTITPNDTIFDFFDKYGKRQEAEELNEAEAGSDISIILDRIANENKVTEKEFSDIANNTVLFPGAAYFYQELEEKGAKLLLLSASYTPIIKRISERLGLKQPIICATEIKWKNTVVGKCDRVVEVEEKQKALLEVATQQGMQLEKTIGIADSQSDRFFMGAIKEAGGCCFWVKGQPDFARILEDILKIRWKK